MAADDGATGPIDWPAVHRRRAKAARLAEEAIAPSAEMVRQILDARARKAAQPSEPAAPGGETVELVAFGLAGSTYLLESDFVREVQSSPAIVRVPRGPAHLGGIVNLRGELAPVFALGVYYGLGDDPGQGASTALVIGDRQAEFAILVDWVAPAEQMPASLFHEVASAGERRSKHARGMTADGRVLLDGRALIAEPDFFLQS